MLLEIDPVLENNQGTADRRERLGNAATAIAKSSFEMLPSDMECVVSIVETGWVSTALSSLVIDRTLEQHCTIGVKIFAWKEAHRNGSIDDVEGAFSFGFSG